MNSVYLDYAATTPIDLRVIERMLPALVDNFGNSSSLHKFGRNAKKAIEQAQEEVALLIGAQASEIIWTSGATESINLALKGGAQLYQSKGNHIITWKTEHKAVLDSVQYLEKHGFKATYLSPQPSGLIDLAQLIEAITPQTILVSVLHLNNEMGVMQDLQKIAEVTAERGILLHVDAVQSVGKIPIDVKKIPCDLMSFNAHKVYGPKGVGALYVRRRPRIRVAAQIHGGGQQSGMRSGTLPTHQIVGMGAALQLAHKEMDANYHYLTGLKNYFLTGCKQFDITTFQHDIFPGICNVRFNGVDAEKLLANIPEVAAALGSACDSKGDEPSYVLRALGLSNSEAQSAIRFSFGRLTTTGEIDYVMQRLADVLARGW